MAAPSKPLSRYARELVDLWSDLFGRHNILVYASAIAFQTLVALFPLLLLGLALLAATGHQGVWANNIAPTVQRQVTPPVYNGIDFTVRVERSPRRGTRSDASAASRRKIAGAGNGNRSVSFIVSSASDIATAATSTTIPNATISLTREP